MALTLITGLVFGIVPAIGVSGVKIQEALKSSGSGYGGSRGAASFRRLLVVVELGVSLVLLIAAGLLAKSFLNLSRIELGFPSANLLTLRVNLTGPEYATAKSQERYYAQALERVRQLPMVRAAAFSTDLPLTGDQSFQNIGFQVAGRVPLPMAQRPQANMTKASPDFFHTMGIPLRSGRLIEVPEKQPNEVVVNEAFARKIFPGEDPLGQRIVFGRNDATQWTIVGVVGSIRGNDLGAEPEPRMYRYIGQNEDRFLSRMRLSVRTTGDPLAVLRAVEGQLYAVDRSQPVFDVKTMDQRVADTLAPQRFQLLLIGTFAAMAVILAALGVYGVMAYVVTRRTREIGIRMAIGARPEQVRGTDPARVAGARRNCRGGGCRRGVGADALPHCHVVRRHAGRWRHLLGGGARAGGGGDGSVALAGAQGVARGPGGGITRRVTAGCGAGWKPAADCQSACRALANACPDSPGRLPIGRRLTICPTKACRRTPFDWRTAYRV